MAKVINIVGSSSNVGKTFVMEGLIKELKRRNFKIATIKHDIHGFDIDYEGKDTYKHRKAGADTVIISSKNRYAEIRELEYEIDLKSIIEKVYKTNDIVLVEGYKNSNLRKIEVFKNELSDKIFSPVEKLIAVASDVEIDIKGIKVLKKTDFKGLGDLIEKEEEFRFEDY